MKIERTGCSETLAFKLQTAGNHPEESVRRAEQGESLKLRINVLIVRFLAVKYFTAKNSFIFI
jgi:hypothetical protein